MNSKNRKYLSLLALSLSGGSIYFLPYLKYIFYDMQMEVMGISNQQSGMLLSMYAIGCILLYVPGGIIADKLSPKKSLIFSLLGTSVLCLIYGFTFNFTISIIIWLLLSVSSAFVFWASLMKAIRLIGTEKEQGKLYGLYYAGNGLTGALMNALALWASGFGTDARSSLFLAVLVGAAFSALAATGVFLFLKEDKKEKGTTNDSEKFKFSDVGQLLKNPIVWVFSIIIMCGYGIFSSSTYFTPYLTDVRGISATSSGVFTIIRSYVFLLLAPLGGILADKVFKSTSRWFVIDFLILAVLFGGILILPSSISPMGAAIYSLLPGAFAMMLYGIVFSIISEAKIPRKFTGTAIGIASIIGYLPDFFYSIMFGSWLDKYGHQGYTMIFGYLAASALVGCILALILRKRSLKLNDTQ